MSKSKKSRSGSNSGSGKNFNSSNSSGSGLKSYSGGHYHISDNERYIQEKEKQGCKRICIRNHFDGNGKHPNIIVYDLEPIRRYVSVGLTREPDDGGGLNGANCETRPLKEKLFYDQKKKSYRCVHAVVDPYSKYEKNDYYGVVSPEDYSEVVNSANDSKNDFLKSRGVPVTQFKKYTPHKKNK